MIREVDGGASSHLSQSSVMSHFGLGDNLLIDTIRIYWTGGVVQELLAQEINKTLTIKEPVMGKDNVPMSFYLVSLIVLIFGAYFLNKRKPLLS